MTWKRHHDQMMPRFMSNVNTTAQDTPTTNIDQPIVNNYVPESESIPSTVSLDPDFGTTIPESKDIEPPHDDLLYNEPSGGIADSVVPPTPIVRRSQRIIKPPDRLNL